MGQNFLMKAASVFLIAIVAPVAAFAQEEDTGVFFEEGGSREPAAVRSARVEDPAASSRARYRLYPGGQDEQDLQVQATLPQTQRSLDPSLLLPSLSSEE